MAQKKKIALVLSGCGVFDGSEIHEAVLTLLAIDRAGAEAVCLAPNIPQRQVVNHITEEVVEHEVRNVLTESARIARGKITDLAKCKVTEVDAAIFPGGYGAAKNLSTYAQEGTRCEVVPAVAKFITAMHKAGKPMGFLCISPVIVAKVLGQNSVSLTVGHDEATSNALEEMGAKHVECPVNETHVDSSNRIVTSPAYMCDAPISQIAEGIQKCVQAVLQLVS